MPTLKLKIPPLLLVLLTAALMWLLARATPTLTSPLPARHLLATCTALAGLLITLLGVRSFRRAGTTVNPLHPNRASSLVTSGIYRHTRNPMYLGFLVLLIAPALLLSNPVALLPLPAFVLYMNHFQITPEESALSSTFGPEFTDYKSNVRRWI